MALTENDLKFPMNPDTRKKFDNMSNREITDAYVDYISDEAVRSAHDSLRGVLGEDEITLDSLLHMVSNDHIKDVVKERFSAEEAQEFYSRTASALIPHWNFIDNDDYNHLALYKVLQAGKIDLTPKEEKKLLRSALRDVMSSNHNLVGESLEEMHQLGMLQKILPELEELKSIRKGETTAWENTMETIKNLPEHAPRSTVMATLFRDTGEKIDDIAKRLRLSPEDHATIRAAAEIRDDRIDNPEKIRKKIKDIFSECHVTEKDLKERTGKTLRTFFNKVVDTLAMITVADIAATKHDQNKADEAKKLLEAAKEPLKGKEKTKSAPHHEPRMR